MVAQTPIQTAVRMKQKKKASGFAPLKYIKKEQKKKIGKKILSNIVTIMPRNYNI